MKKRIFLLCGIFIMIFLLCSCGISGGYSSVLDANWGFSLPAEAKCKNVYEKDAGPSFQGDGIRYHVFSYKNEEPIETLLEWSETESGTLFHGGYSNAAKVWLDEIDVPQNERPVYETCVYWYDKQKDNSEIIVFWDDEADRLYIAESFL